MSSRPRLVGRDSCSRQPAGVTALFTVGPMMDGGLGALSNEYGNWVSPAASHSLRAGDENSGKCSGLADGGVALFSRFRKSGMGGNAADTSGHRRPKMATRNR